MDNDKFGQFIYYNPYIYDGDFNKYSNLPKIPKANWNAYLNKVKYISNKTLEQIKDLQKEYEEKKEIYNSEKIKEMNQSVFIYKGVLNIFEIALFSYFLFILFSYITCCSCYKCRERCKCFCFENLTPKKAVLLFYLICLPIIIFSIFGLFVNISQKLIYNEYSSMKYIDEFKYKDYFEKSITFHKVQFIAFIIMISLFLLYPILIYLASLKKLLELFQNPIYRPPQPIYENLPQEPLYPGEQH